MNSTLMAGIPTWAKQVAALPPCIHNTVFIVAAYPRMLAMAFKPSRCTKWQARQVTLNGQAPWPVWCTVPIFPLAGWSGEKYATSNRSLSMSRRADLVPAMQDRADPAAAGVALDAGCGGCP
jgi:hypothetical protein